MPFTAPVSTKLMLAGQIFVKNFYTIFHENPASSLVTDISDGQVDRHGLHIKYSFLLCKNLLEVSISNNEK
jgi:hypothetical protein